MLLHSLTAFSALTPGEHFGAGLSSKKPNHLLTALRVDVKARQAAQLHSVSFSALTRGAASLKGDPHLIGANDASLCALPLLAAGR